MLRFSRGRPAPDELHEVYREHVGAVYAFFSYSVSHDAAEDLTAATFERVVRSWSRFDPQRAGPRTWILAIARNQLTDHFRRQHHRAGPSLEAHPELAETLAAGDDAIDLFVSKETARSWLSRLGEREREVLALRYGADLTSSETGRLLGLSEANVLQISSRALRRLREELAPERVSDSS